MDELKRFAERIAAGEDIETVAADFPDLMIVHVSRRSTCEHRWDGPPYTSADGGTWSATCSRCGMAAINDPSIWD